MPGLQKETVNFLVNLSNNNNREWFQVNRNYYEQAQTDFQRLVFTLIAGISHFDKSIGALEPRDCIFRIYRDVRFSANKNPYKENFGAFIAPGGRKSSGCGYYIHIQPGGSFASGGLYMAPAPVMKAVRTAMVENRSEFLSVVNNPKFKSTFTWEGVEQAKRTPAGFEFDPELDLFLRLKHITPSRDFTDDELFHPDFDLRAIEVFETLSPLVKFLNQAIP
ncbi:DUF2461 domain-containing protein [Tenuifilum osseticum]|uniref:DUF2461 domain-containing protein n=1 Tax=Tenuifilum osseticum TaxID=3374723 RepID=UPI0034E42DC5